MEKNASDELSLKLEKSIHTLFRRMYLKNRNSRNRTQGKILKVLYVKGPMSQKEMQEKLDIQSGSISEIVNKLEKKGLVYRKPDLADRRRVVLYLTEKGRKDVEAFDREYQTHVDSFFLVLEEEEKLELERLLHKLLEQENE